MSSPHTGPGPDQATRGEPRIDYGDPPAPIEASICALTCADEAIWADEPADGEPVSAPSAHVHP
jgi:hypothetical protein